jgi:hypothetical protein
MPGVGMEDAPALKPMPFYLPVCRAVPQRASILSLALMRSHLHVFRVVPVLFFLILSQQLTEPQAGCKKGKGNSVQRKEVW